MNTNVVIGKQERLKQANELLQVIAACGRKFYQHEGRVSRFELDGRGRIWFVDCWRGARIYTHYTRGRWQGFSEGGTLRDVVIRLRDYIRMGKQCGYTFGPWPDWYSQGDPWGYGADMQKIADAAVRLGIVKMPVDYASGKDRTVYSVVTVETEE